MAEEYESVADRQKVGQSRVNSELTDVARERLAEITSNPARIRRVEHGGQGRVIPDHVIRNARRLTEEDVGYSAVRDFAFPSHGEPRSAHRNLIEGAETETVLAYIEHLLAEANRANAQEWREVSHFPLIPYSESIALVEEKLAETVEKVNIVLETEGILWELKEDDGRFNFYPIGSEMMQEAERSLAAVATEQKWKSVLAPYDAAYELDLDRKYGKEIPEKLYNSIEELARVICVDLESWEDNRELNLSNYLDAMRDHGLFSPNNIMEPELEDLARSMEKAFQKAGAERKNRHVEIDREYATLLLHQVSAYLTFIIRRYEDSLEE